MPIRNIVIKKFVENWPVSKEVLRLQPEVDPRIVDLLDQIYQCITTNQVGSRAEYDAKCKDLADWGQFEAYVYSYVASAVGQERKTYARTEQKTRVAVESAVGEVIQKVAEQVGRTAEWNAAFTSELVKLLTPLAMSVLKERGLNEKTLAEITPQEAAKYVAEGLNLVWEFKQHQDQMLRELGELRAKTAELESLVKFYEYLLDAVVKYVPDAIEGIVRELAELGSAKNPQLAALAAALTS